MAFSNPNQDLNPGLPHINSPNSPPRSYYMNGKVFLVAGIVLVIIVVFILAFHVYVRVFWRRRGTLTLWHRNLGSHDMPLTGGLDKAVIDSLPTFTYTVPLLHQGGNVVSKEAGAGYVECAVCLIEFEENDVCRLLPKCNHSFHTECIDRWFLSNTTCPLCRTSAEAVDSDDACHTESSTALCLPHQNHGDHIERSNSSPSDCLLPQQDSGSHMQRQNINSHMQRSRSTSPLAAELEGAGLHVRRMLARTCSSRVDAQYDLVGEDMHNNTIFEPLHIERNGNMGRDRSHRNHAGEAFVRHLHLPNWQRSVSDRSLGTRQRMQFPSNVLFWGNHSHVDSHLDTDQWRVGGRSLPHITIDVPRPQDSVLTSHSSVSSPLQCFSTSERPCVLSSSVQCQPSRMNSLKSEESAIHLAEHEMYRYDGTSSNMWT